VRTSAGILLYRLNAGELEVLLVHPGGPFWAKRDAGAWSIPKGEYDAGDDPFAAALREFAEELGSEPPAALREFAEEPGSEAPGPTGLIDLGEIRQKSGKRVRAWATAGDLDVATVRSNTVPIEWPPRSGRTIEVPEVDRAEWFAVPVAREKINSAQVALLQRLLDALA
jgi:predicted NUDIX family NTP pyrophosphohydrolase